MHHSSARDNQLFIQQHFRKGVLFVFYCAYSLASCGSSQHSCSGGTKNSPPDCFLNVPTVLKEIITLFHSTTLSLRKRCFSLYTVFTLCSCGSQRDNYFSIKGIPFYFTVKKATPLSKTEWQKIYAFGLHGQSQFSLSGGKNCSTGNSILWNAVHGS